jgi:ubiquinone/menaquinone biosynthesis C-methylase UbiE
MMTYCSETTSSPQGIGACQPSKWTSQFMRPSGWRGQFVGYVMAAKNAAMNQLAVEQLNIKSHDHILEIGFGPGTAIESAALRLTSGLIAGVDVSDVMLRQASWRNRRFIRDGRVEIKLGSVLQLPYLDSLFDKVFAVNSFHTWPDQQKALGEIRRVLKVGGILLLQLRHKHPTRRWLVPPGFTENEIAQVLLMLDRTGFKNIRSQVYRVDQGVTCVFGQRIE